MWNFIQIFQKYGILILVMEMEKEVLIDENKTTLDTDYYNFLIKRENKLQMIDQMFKSGTVDLSDLAALVEEKWKR